MKKIYLCSGSYGPIVRTVWFVFAPFSYCMDANEFRVDTGLRGFLVCFNFSRCQCLRNKTGLFISFFSVHVHVSKQKNQH